MTERTSRRRTDCETGDLSVTNWVERLRRGDEAAAAKLWSHYFTRLVAVARGRLATIDRRVSDEEDIASEVLAALCRAADDRRLPPLGSRDDLWHLLLSYLRGRVVDQARRTQATKRGGGRVRGHSALKNPSDSADATFDRLPEDGPTPADVVAMHEQAGVLLSLLPSDQHRDIALAKLAGRTTAEVAAALGIAPRTVERKLAIIRRLWREEG